MLAELISWFIPSISCCCSQNSCTLLVFVVYFPLRNIVVYVCLHRKAFYWSSHGILAVQLCCLNYETKKVPRACRSLCGFILKVIGLLFTEQCNIIVWLSSTLLHEWMLSFHEIALFDLRNLSMLRFHLLACLEKIWLLELNLILRRNIEIYSCFIR